MPVSSAATSGLAAIAYTGIGHPYVWGGTTPNGWDCSGFTQWVYAQAGISIPRVNAWTAMKPTSTPSPGDLVMQNGGAHVGIYVGNGMMISALNPGQGTLLHSVASTGTSSFLHPPLKLIPVRGRPAYPQMPARPLTRVHPNCMRIRKEKIMTSANKLARHRAEAPKTSSLAVIAKAVSSNAGGVGRQAAVIAAASGLVLTSGIAANAADTNVDRESTSTSTLTSSR